MKIFYFTGTGNSLYVAKKFNCELYSIPQVLKGNINIFEDEKIGIVFPVYKHSIPTIVEEFLKNIYLKSPYIFSILTCGDNSGDATKYLVSFAKKCGTEIHYSNSIAMTGNHIPYVDIEKEKYLDKNIDNNISKLIEDIWNNKNFIKYGKIIDPLLRNILKTVNKIYPLDSPKNFSVSESCIKCGTCIKVCPRSNVSFTESNLIIFGNNCESCLSCVHNCIKQCIQVKSDSNPLSRFRNEHITLKEIIDSNNQ